MKRSELKRSPSSSLKRKQAKRTPGQDEFWRAVTYDGEAVCWFALGMDYEDGRCDYWNDRPDAHHLIPKQRIESYFDTLVQALYPFVPTEVEAGRGEALKDPRNGIPVCRFHHNQIEAHRIKLTASDLPPSVLEFATEYGLEAQLEKLYPGSSAYRKGSG